MKSTIIIIFYCGIWLVFTQGSDAFLLIGIPVIWGAMWVKRYLTPINTHSISASHLLQFIPYFLYESFKGGIDVALYTLGLRSNTNSSFYYFYCKLDSPQERIFFSNCVSMMPGTLTVDLQGDWIEVHSLNLNNQTISELVRLEGIVVKLFNSQEQL